MGYLDQLDGMITFDLSKHNVFCKKNFFSTTAWYIEILKKEKPAGWEKEIQDFIDSISNGSFGKGVDLLKNINIFFCQTQLKWFKENGDQTSARAMEIILRNRDYIFIEEENGKTSSSITGIKTDLIPEWYYEWTMNSGLSREVRDKNAENIVQSFSNNAK